MDALQVGIDVARALEQARVCSDTESTQETMKAHHHVRIAGNGKMQGIILDVSAVCTPKDKSGNFTLCTVWSAPGSY